MKKIKLFLLFVVCSCLLTFNAYSETFDEWKIKFSNYAISQGVSEKTLSLIIKDLKFLPKVIEVDLRSYQRKAELAALSQAVRPTDGWVVRTQAVEGQCKVRHELKTEFVSIFITLSHQVVFDTNAIILLTYRVNSRWQSGAATQFIC